MTHGSSRVRSMLVALAVLALRGPAPAFGYEDALADGTLLPGSGPFSMAFGGVRSTGLGDPSCLFLNPADLSRVSSSAFLVCVGPGIGHEVVDVGQGRSERSNLGLGPTEGCFRISLGQRAGLGAGITRVSDFTYDATQYVASDSLQPDQITYSESFKSTGGLWEAAGGFGWRFVRWMSAGASLGTRFGGGSVDFAHDDWVGEDDSLYSSDWSESSLCAHLGVSAVFGLNSIGVSYATSSDHYPDVLSAGAMLFSGGEGSGMIGFEGEITDPSEAAQFTGKLFGSVSPDRTFSMRGSLLFGSRGTSSEKRSVLGFGLGASVDLGKASMEGAFLSTRMAREEGGAFGFEQVERIVDTVSLVTLGLSYTF